MQQWKPKRYPCTLYLTMNLAIKHSLAHSQLKYITIYPIFTLKHINDWTVEHFSLFNALHIISCQLIDTLASDFSFCFSFSFRIFFFVEISLLCARTSVANLSCRKSNQNPNEARNYVRYCTSVCMRILGVIANRVSVAI